MSLSRSNDATIEAIEANEATTEALEATIEAISAIEATIEASGATIVAAIEATINAPVEARSIFRVNSSLCVNPLTRSSPLLGSAAIRFSHTSDTTNEAISAMEATIEAIEATIEAIKATIEASIGATYEATIGATVEVIGAIKSTNDSPALILAVMSS